MFESFDAFRAHCGTQLEDCALCSEIPDRCDRSWVSSLVSDYDIDYGDEGDARKWNNVAPGIAQLETFIETPTASRSRTETVLRCPTCRRLYLCDDQRDDVGATMYSTTVYQRFDVDALFRSRWCLSRRLADRTVDDVYPQQFFPHHTIARFKGSPTWYAVDDTNQVVKLHRDHLPTLIASDPPRVDARLFALFVHAIDDRNAMLVESFDEIRWRDDLGDDDRQQIEAARAASRIEPAVVEQGDPLVIRSWLISGQRLICRVLTVRATGLLREDAVIAENLPCKVS